MKFVLFIFLCLFFGASAVFAQDETTDENAAQREEVGVELVWLARDDGNGKSGEETSVFLTNDIPIYCSVQLNSQKSATVKMNLVAVSVAGVKADTKVVAVSYKTNGKQNRVNFTGTPDGGAWTAGKYRVDVFVDGKLGATKEFEVQKTASQKSEKKIQTKPKTNVKPKVANQKRKN